MPRQDNVAGKLTLISINDGVYCCSEKILIGVNIMTKVVTPKNYINREKNLHSENQLYARVFFPGEHRELLALDFV